MKKLLLIVTLAAFCAEAQDYQSQYLAAKQDFRTENYRLAQRGFQQVINSDPANSFASYASFYYGMCSYQLGQISLAKDMWRQVETKYPRWKQKDELYYWLSRVHLESDNIDLSLPYFDQVIDTTVKGQMLVLLDSAVTQVDSLQLMENWYNSHAENPVVAKRYGQLLLARPLSKAQLEIVKEIDERFGLLSSRRNIKKDLYKVAVLLPFMYESLSNTAVISRNKFVMDMYQGMDLAARHLDTMGIDIQLLPYDTRRRVADTETIIAREELKTVDLIVGPLYPQPFQVVNEFSKQYQINMINPLSGNSKIISDNENSFLFRPTYQSMARQAAEFAMANYSEDEDLMIFFEDDQRFEVMANTYAQVMTDSGFNVVRTTRLEKGNSREILDLLTSNYEEVLTPAERDSIMQIPGRQVKNREPQNSKDTIQYYEERYDLGLDSLGHIFVSSTNSLIAANAVGGIEVRGDKIPIVGMGEWMDFNVLTLEQFERLGVAMVHPTFINYENGYANAIENELTQLYRQQPSLNQLTGYELIWFVGQKLFENGVYFQQGLHDGVYQPGCVFSGFQYGYARDNQIVPIVKMIESNLQIVNIEDESADQ